MKQLLLLIILIATTACGQNSNTQWAIEKQHQIDGNVSVVENLKKNGEKFIVARDVFHYIYFKSSDDREAYLKIVLKEGYLLVAKNETKGQFPFELQIKRSDKVTIEEVNTYTLYLWELAKKHQGEYDGWETSVEK